MKQWRARQLRQQPYQPQLAQQIRRSPIAFLLDQLNDTYNIGSFFRLADAIAAEKVYLGGPMVTPPNPKIHRAAVGTWRWTPWEYQRDSLALIRHLKQQGYQIVAVEQTRRSVFYWQFQPHFPLLLILGNESRGINSSLLRVSSVHLKLPMAGINHSLNVFAAGAVVAYYLYQQFLLQAGAAAGLTST